MRDPCCNDIIGGEVFITARFSGAGGGGFARYEGMGEVRVQPTRLERTAGASTAGSVWVVEVSRPVRALLNWVNRCDYNPMRIFRGRCRMDISIIEKSRGFEHAFSDALSVGLPEINLSTGEVSGMEIVTDRYSISAASSGPSLVSEGLLQAA